MKQLTSLPVLLSTLFLWTLWGAIGCGGNAQTGGTGGSGGADTGGSDTGGNETGGSSTGGSSTGGTGGSAVPECVSYPASVYGCLQSSSFPPDPVQPLILDATGVVAAVRPPNEGEVCGQGYYYIGWAAPETMIDLTLADGTALTIGLNVPGFSQSAVAEGDMLSVHFSFEFVEWGGSLALLEIERDGALVAAIGENMPAGPAPSEGATECYSEDELCGRRGITMDVPAPDGTIVSIPNGESAQVGDLTVTNERYFQNYDTSGGCNFGLSVEYLMSAAAAQ